MAQDHNRLSNPLTLGLALIGGTGLILMVVALGIGVAVPDADAATTGGLLLFGAMALVSGIVGWAIVVRPSAHFDDINVPKDIHVHTEDHDTHDAIVVADTTAVEPHAPSHS